ncbi:MAG: 2OG-Fe(II) oxygenase [Pseudomonadota bacterium]
MREIIDLEAYPIDQPDAPAALRLVEDCRARLAADGMFTLDGFMRPEAVAAALAPLKPKFETESFLHQRSHNIYFKDEVDGLSPDHPALAKRETTNRTLCADQLGDNPLIALYEAPAFAAFLAAVMEKPALFTMDDPLARVNVMTYRAGEALNWHFDRSEFTTTLLLEAPEDGGAFEYRTDLRTDDDPNFDGVARLLRGEDPEVKRISLNPGALNVFRGKNTPHRVTPPKGARNRTIAVFSFYETPGTAFSAVERQGFYGRS